MVCSHSLSLLFLSDCIFHLLLMTFQSFSKLRYSPSFRCTPASGHLHLLFPLTGTTFPGYLQDSLSWDFDSNVTTSLRISLPILRFLHFPTPTTSAYIFVFKVIYFGCTGSWVFLVAHRLRVSCGIQFPDQGLNLSPLHREHGVLSTGPPGRSPKCRELVCIALLDFSPSLTLTTIYWTTYFTY